MVGRENPVRRETRAIPPRPNRWPSKAATRCCCRSFRSEGALRQALDGPIDGRPRKPRKTRDQGNTSSSQSLAIEGSDQVLLSLIQIGGGVASGSRWPDRWSAEKTP